jgi:hypothetical protein
VPATAPFLVFTVRRSTLWRLGSNSRSDLVEVVTGVAAIRQQLAGLQRGAREAIVWFCTAGHVAMPSSDNAEEFEMPAKGVRHRVIYEQALLEETGMVENVADDFRRARSPGPASTLRATP